MNYFAKATIGVYASLAFVACGEQKAGSQRSSAGGTTTASQSQTAAPSASSLGQKSAATSGGASSTPATASSGDAAKAPGQLDSAQMESLLIKLPSYNGTITTPTTAAAATAPATSSSQAAATPTDMNSQVSAAIKNAFTTKMAANPGALTQAQADLLTKQITAFVSASAAKDPAASASAWNTLSANLSSIKTSKHSSGFGLDVTVNNTAAASGASADSAGGLSYGGTGLVSDVLGLLVGSPIISVGSGVATTTGKAVATTTGGYGILGAAGGLVGGVLGTVVNTLAGVLAVALELVDSVLTLNVGGVVQSAVDLVGVVIDFVI